MHAKALCIAISASLALSAWGASPSVRVEYINPEKFTDVGERNPGSGKAREAHLESLRKHIVERASALLSEGQALEVAITDVDMAGSFEPWRRPAGSDLRIIRDIYPPRVDLRYRLLGSDGSVIREGERQLRDSGFLMSSDSFSSDPLRHEKALIDRWLAGELKPRG